MKKPSPQTLLWRIYVANFFYALQYAVVLYALSTYVAGFVGEDKLSLVYSASAVVIIILSFNFSRLIRRISLRTFTLACILLTLVCLTVLTLSGNALLSVMAVVGYLTFEFLLLICFDLYLEDLSKNTVTGNIRGLNLTMQSAAFVLGPMITGAFLVNDTYRLMFLVSLLLTLPVGLIYLFGLREVKTPPPRHGKIKEAVRILRANLDLRTIFFSGCALEFFYVWMTVYTPLYLYTRVGFSPQDTAIIFAIMLLPFLLFELPLGIIADRYWGEKEILISGYVVAGIATAGLFFLTAKSILLWALMLFLTRVGAAMIEVMNETYFFKHVGAKDASIIMLFRNTRQYNYILAPLAASAILLFLPFKALFLILGLLMFLMSVYLGRLRDTN